MPLHLTICIRTCTNRLCFKRLAWPACRHLIRDNALNIIFHIDVVDDRNRAARCRIHKIAAVFILIKPCQSTLGRNRQCIGAGLIQCLSGLSVGHNKTVALCPNGQFSIGYAARRLKSRSIHRADIIARSIYILQLRRAHRARAIRQSNPHGHTICRPCRVARRQAQQHPCGNNRRPSPFSHGFLLFSPILS